MKKAKAPSQVQTPSSDGGFTDPRIALASERTLLAWVRTGLAMIGLGFVIARFGLYLDEALNLPDQVQKTHHNWSLAMGLGIVLLGIIVLIASAIRHGRYIAALRRGQILEPAAAFYSIATAIVLALLGLVMFLYLLTTVQVAR